MTRQHTQAHLDLKRRFGDNLILLRDRVDISQKQIALRSGLHTTQIGLLERGQRMPRLDTIIKLAGALEVTPCDLLDGMTWRLSIYQGRGTYVRSDTGGATARQTESF
jgi:transcriptional regulator with XRE-family HTH domain